MSQPRYQVHLQNYNFDRTKPTKNVRPKIYSDVDSANSAAHDWLQHLQSEDEVVRIVKIEKEGMMVQATVNVKDRENIFSWAEVLRVGEGMDEAGDGASIGGKEVGK